jgi:hypothetical protein
VASGGGVAGARANWEGEKSILVVRGGNGSSWQGLHDGARWAGMSTGEGP